MTEKELRLWMLKEKADDTWWVSLDGAISAEPVRLSAVYRLEGIETASRVTLLHASQKASEDPPWVDFDPEAELDETGRKRLVKRQRLGRAFFIQILVLLVIAGGLGYYLLKPETEPPVVIQDPVEKVLSSLAREQANSGGSHEPALPTLRAAVACTDRIVFISNLTPEVWSGCEVQLEGPVGTYTYRMGKPVVTHQTLSVPLRHFLKDGESYPSESAQPERVVLKVPGYRDWEERLR